MAELFDSLVAALVLRTFVQYITAFCSRLEAANNITSSRFVGLNVPDKRLEFHDPHLNHSLEIRAKDSTFDRFSNFVKCRPEVAGEVISGMAMVVRAKFGDSRLNSGGTIRLFGRPDQFCSLLCSIAVNRKQLVASYLAGL